MTARGASGSAAASGAERAVRRAGAALEKGDFHAVLKHLKPLRRGTGATPTPVRYLAGLALHGLGRTAEAHRELEAVAAADPKGQAGLFAAGTVALDQERWERAYDAFAGLSRLQPGVPQILNNLALSARGMGDVGKAAALWRRVLQAAPAMREARLNLAESLLQAGAFDEAKGILPAPASEDRPDLEAESLALRAETYAQDLDAARARAARLERFWDPRAPIAADLVRLDSVLGRSDQAALRALEIVRAGGAASDCLLTLLDLAERLPDPAAAREAAFDYARARAGEAADEGAGPLGGPGALLALGETLERAGELAAAARLYERGNALLRAQLASFGRRFDPPRYETVAAAQEAAADSLLPAARRARGADETPEAIFIVGLPRSGTSLFAQILDAHSRCRSVGESQALPALCRELGLGDVETPDPAGLERLRAADAAQRARWRAAYFEAVGLDPAGGAIPVDKNMYNGLFATILPALFERPAILHIVRDFADNALSVYAKKFVRNPPFTCDLAALDQFERALSRAVAAAAVAAPEAVRREPYEAFVEDPDARLPAMLGWLGLPFEERCARFFEQPSSVLTASRDQVRRPMFTSSIGRGAAMAAHLPGLIRPAAEDAED
ncbi:MAG: sulfotransferase [Marivibrio sp.]|uniref:tetratricopeptide repeat-containing sulfotransferase family protein n=1 Tax=Marivibrio sp. TaxID=2039719 RepID=UPI0032EB2080